MGKKKLVTENAKYRYFVHINLFDDSPQLYRIDRKTKEVMFLAYDPNKDFMPSAFTFRELLKCAGTKEILA